MGGLGRHVMTSNQAGHEQRDDEQREHDGGTSYGYLHSPAQSGMPRPSTPGRRSGRTPHAVTATATT